MAQEQTSEGRLDFKELSRRYHLLTVEEQNHLDNVGSQASQMHRQGLQAFPDTHNAIHRKHLKRARAEGRSRIDEIPGFAAFLPAFSDVGDEQACLPLRILDDSYAKDVFRFPPPAARIPSQALSRQSKKPQF